MEVTVNLDDIKSHLRHILAPDGPISPSAYDDFATRCKDVNTSPWNIIRRISLFMKCPKAVSTTVDDYLNINKMFQEMAKRQDGSELTDSDKIFLHYNEQFMRIFMLNNSTKFVTNIQEKVKSQKLSFHKIDNLKSFLDEELDFEESLLNAVGTGLCMIDDFMAKNHWTTETGLAMAISVESDIYLAYMIGGFCTGMAYDGPLGDQGKDLQKLFQSISGYANNRTLELLEATWPRIDLYQIEKLMKDVPFKGTKSEDLNQKAKKLWDNLKPIGPSGYSKQIVITGFSIVPNSYTLKCDPVFCTSYNSSINEAG
uniref:Uncharacterized protein n=1 Tax=Panagrolaimus sp. PS1159 TaxID=55785 RepID=A0AC35FFY7_9BILA